MNMQKGLLVVLLVIVSGIGGFVIGHGGDGDGDRFEHGKNQAADTSMGGMHDEMGSMMMGLNGKTGDDLDKAFLSEMIVHHQGAVDMAQAVLKDGKHPELKQMAEAIVAAQTKEIAQMKSWQARWYAK